MFEYLVINVKKCLFSFKFWNLVMSAFRENLDAGTFIDNLDSEDITVFPPDFPTPLENDWTAKLSLKSAAELEFSACEGILFTRIGPEKIEKLPNANEKLRESLNKLKRLSEDDREAIKNLFFDAKTGILCQFVEVMENRGTKYDFETNLLTRIQVIIEILNCFSVCLGDASVLIKYNTDTYGKAVGIKTKIENLGLSVSTAESSKKKKSNPSSGKHQVDGYSPVDQMKSILGRKPHFKNLLDFFAQACQNVHFFTLRNPRINIQHAGVGAICEENLINYLNIGAPQEVRKLDDKLKMVPESQELFWEMPLREAMEEGVCPGNTKTKCKGELTDLYQEQIHHLRSRMKGTLLYSVDSKMLQPFISFPTGQRFEIDWVLFLFRTVLFIETSGAKHHKQVSTRIAERIPGVRPWLTKRRPCSTEKCMKRPCSSQMAYFS